MTNQGNLFMGEPEGGNPTTWYLPLGTYLLNSEAEFPEDLVPYHETIKVVVKIYRTHAGNIHTCTKNQTGFGVFNDMCETVAYRTIEIPAGVKEQPPV